MPKTVLSILAHPDDAEFLCAGTMIRLVREHDWIAHIASMTPGDCGSAELSNDEIAAIRRKEGAAAARLIDAGYACLEERDLQIVYGPNTVAKVTQLLRDLRPNLVLTHSPADYMLDHEVTSTVVRAACFAAPVPNFRKDLDLSPPLEAIPHLYYCDPIEGRDIFGKEIRSSLSIDITRVIETKVAMLTAHASQRDWLLKHHGVDQYTQVMREWAARSGAKAGVQFAEGFRQHLGHSYPQNDWLRELLHS